MSADQTKAIVRSALESSGMAETCDKLRDIFGARMTYLKVGDLEIGTPDTEQGITMDKIVLVDWERKKPRRKKEGGIERICNDGQAVVGNGAKKARSAVQPAPGGIGTARMHDRRGDPVPGGVSGIPNARADHVRDRPQPFGGELGADPAQKVGNGNGRG